jgi:riboflavin kinase / FMN adenylyltransferase
VKVTRLSDAQPRPRRVAVGTFDGVHLGHREVISGSDTVLTFEPHPASVVTPDRAPLLLTTPERKAELIASLGVRELAVLPFDDAFAHRSAEAFIDEVLTGTLGARHVSVGENFRFGHGAAGDAHLLRSRGGFETRVVPLLEVDGEVVSSSHIRGLVLGGAIEYAGELLGTPFTAGGEVAHGDKRGRTLGFPTANLVPRPGYVTPAHGVYACRAMLENGETYAAATNVGVRPMFDSGLGELIEAYLLDFDEDIYGTQLRVEFLKRLRGERRFDSVDALVEQMGRDVEEAREVAASA